MNSFEGFNANAPLFLEQNNIRDDKQWFEEHRQEYNDLLLNPFKNLVTALSPAIIAIDPLLDTKPAIGRTISRIFRDTRFSRNKSFFHSAMWITFKRREENWKNAPAFFFEICPDIWRFGMGYFVPAKTTMDNFRGQIDEDTDAFIAMTKRLNKNISFEVLGEEYKKPVKRVIDPLIARWYNRKSLYLSYSDSDFGKLASPESAGFVSRGLSDLSDFYHFMRLATDGGEQ